MKVTVSNIKLPLGKDKIDDIRLYIAKSFHINSNDISDINIKHKSIDARKKEDIKLVYSVDANIKGGDKILKNPRIKNVSAFKANDYVLPDNFSYRGRPVIVGAGPAGLFCAYLMVEAGIRPIILERGYDVERRKKDIDSFWENGNLNTESNVQFGEGGAGTFSDGKLNTLVNDKNGRSSFVLQTFVRFGAPANILYDSKPHIGTDILIKVIKNMREYICENGGDIRFGSKVTGINISHGCVTGVSLSDTNEEINTDRIVLAIGHSARDTFEYLESIGINMSAKPFAVGFRVEHPREFIDKMQYGTSDNPYLPAAAYKLTAQSDTGHGVYSFCMCPGGYVVNASSEKNMLAVNGMSYSGRNGANSNTAIVVTVNPEDYKCKYVLDGVRYQRELEAKAYELGNGSIPVEQYGRFLNAVKSRNGIDISGNDYRLKDEYGSFLPQTKGCYKEAELDELFSDELNLSILQGMQRFGRIIRGYDAYDTIISGVESRTSSPVKIWREDNGESTNVSGLYPCGEGAGYAGGITSAAMDGLFIAEKILFS